MIAPARPLPPPEGGGGVWRACGSVRWWLWVAGGLAVIAAAGLAPAHRWWDALRERRAVQFTDRGYALWQEGKLREAELAFDSAVELSPGELRPVLLKARMLLATGNGARGHAVFQREIRSLGGNLRSLVAANYHDALLGTAGWPELAALALAELARLHVPDPVWLTAAVEALRLSAPPPGEWGKLASALPLLHPTARAAVQAQVALNDGRGEAAAAHLHAITGVLRPQVSLILARLWLRAGRPEEARLVLARVGQTLSPDDTAQAALVLAALEPGLAARAAQQLCAGPWTKERELGAILVGLSLALGAPVNSVALAFSRGLEPVHAKMATETMAALWLYCELAGAEEDAPRWRYRLTQRLGSIQLPRDFRPLNQNRFIVISNSVPLRRDTVYGLLGTLAPVPPR